MVFQSYGLYPHKDVRGNLGFALKHAKVPQKEIDERVNKASDILGLSELMKRKPRELSGGQRQRVAIARSLILNPSFMILDEPTSALDRSIQIQVIELLKNIQKQYELTYLFISHDLKVVRSMSDYIFVMQNGVIVESGPAKQVFSNPEEDYTDKLLNAALRYSTV